MFGLDRFRSPTNVAGFVPQLTWPGDLKTGFVSGAELREAEGKEPAASGSVHYTCVTVV